MRGKPEGGELDPAEGIRRRCKKNSPSVLFCIGKRTREGCDRGSEVGTVHRASSSENFKLDKNRTITSPVRSRLQ